MAAKSMRALLRAEQESGRERARAVVRDRKRAITRRSAVLKRKVKARSVVSSAARGTVEIPQVRIRAAGASGNAGVIVAEGDSWFDYPGADVLGILEDDYAYEVESVAHKGDRVEDMAYGDDQLVELSRRLERLLRRQVVPKAILLSGGGNDIAGDEFGVLLNHQRSGIRGLNPRIVEGIIDERLRLSYVRILSAVTTVCDECVGRRIPVVVHGYDHPVPDGRGFFGGWFFFPGPWLEPGFRAKGFSQLSERTILMRTLIDRFNAMLQDVVGLPGFGHVKYLDLRGTLTTGAGYKRAWANELHPTKDGFQAVTKKFATLLERL